MTEDKVKDKDRIKKRNVAAAALSHPAKKSFQLMILLTLALLAS